MNDPRAAPAPNAPGLSARNVAADLIDGVLRRNRTLDEQIEQQARFGIGTLPERDRALARNIASTTLRRLGTLRHALHRFLERGLPADAPRIETVLLVGAAQILFLDVPDHAAVDLSVRLAQGDRRARHYAGLVNAVLRRVAQGARDGSLIGSDASRDVPAWLFARWTRTYGETTAHAIAAANSHEPSLDLTCKDTDQASIEGWAARLRGRVLPTGSVRTIAHGPIATMPGFSEGAWWVQDAAAALPARLFGNVRGRRIADLCAAPGGKTAQLVAAGAHVTAVDRSPRRVARLADNLARLDLAAETVVADAAEWQAEPFDAVLIDAPCSSTGTIRRHPDIAWLKHESDLAGLIDLQRRLLLHAVDLVRAGGLIVFCTCSLEPEEGEMLVAEVLEREPRLRRVPVAASEMTGLEGLLTPLGELRTLPCCWPDAEPRMAGLDGFYAVRLARA